MLPLCPKTSGAPWIIAAAPWLFAFTLGSLGTSEAVPAQQSQAAEAPVALVVAETGYSALPGYPECGASAHALAGALEHVGFEVIVANDTTSGEFSAALISFRALAKKRTASASLLYFCGYSATYSGQTFLLPSSVRLVRDADILAEGIPLRALTDAMRIGPALFDIAHRPDEDPTGPSPFEDMPDLEPAVGSAIAIPAGEAAPGVLGDAAASVIEAADADLSVAGLLGELSATVQTASLSYSEFKTPGIDHPLIGGSGPETSEPPVPASPQRPPEVDEQDTTLTKADRRFIQLELQRLQYYDGQIDGVFGPQTRDAITAFQIEAGAAPTGLLTTSEIRRLLQRSE
ncbi:hypothetical protein CFI11_22715 [Thalassococcus sp. S3]|nr:hypothetical protein CFI11_22715 [Thalassococcus sp. S3]